MKFNRGNKISRHYVDNKVAANEEVKDEITKNEKIAARLTHSIWHNRHLRHEAKLEFSRVSNKTNNNVCCRDEK